MQNLSLCVCRRTWRASSTAKSCLKRLGCKMQWERQKNASEPITSTLILTTQKRIQCNGCKAQGIYFESFNFYFQIQSSNKRSDYFQQVTLRVQICLLASSKLLLKVLGSSFEKNRFLMLFLFRLWALEFLSSILIVLELETERQTNYRLWSSMSKVQIESN